MDKSTPVVWAIKAYSCSKRECNTAKCIGNGVGCFVCFLECFVLFKILFWSPFLRYCKQHPEKTWKRLLKNSDDRKRLHAQITCIWSLIKHLFFNCRVTVVFRDQWYTFPTEKDSPLVTIWKKVSKQLLKPTWNASRGSGYHINVLEYINFNLLLVKTKMKDSQWSPAKFVQ